MKFVLAPDKFKGSLSGIEFCNAVAQGIKKVIPDAQIINSPLADGGDGTIDVINTYLKGEQIKVKVSDPLFRPRSASYLFAEKQHLAFIEMSKASGYRLLKEKELNCLYTTTLGTGQLIVDALDKGAKEIILGIGGSATNDGGIGMAHALGYRFLDSNGEELEPIGKNLAAITTINKDEIDKRLRNVTFKVACDVDNPFYGPNGAAHIYGPQKGANPNEIKSLDIGLQAFAALIKKELGLDLQSISGSGAAGGLGGGAVAFLNATLLSGIDIVKEIANFDKMINNADWIISGEGKLDEQTLSGKTIIGVLTSAKKQNIKVAAFCGAVALSIENQEKIGLEYAVSILRDINTLKEAKKDSFENLVMSAFNFSKIITAK